MDLKVSAAEICQCAKSAYESGDTERGDRFYGMILHALKRFAAEGNAEVALGCETMIYRNLVKAYETEESAERYFSDFRDDMHALGRSFRDGKAWGSGDGIAFVVQTLFGLGHIEALYNTVRMNTGRAPIIAILGRYKPSVAESFEKLGCRIVSALDMCGEKSSLVERMKWMRSTLAVHGVRTAVWVSSASISSFAFGLGLAPKQVFWSHRHHQFIPGADAYICYGDAGTRDYHGREWICCKTPFVNWEAIECKTRLPIYTYGSIAREEKMENVDFLEAVATILNADDHSLYAYCGREDSPRVREFFTSRGLAERTRFLGWVDVNRTVEIIETFLDTFPVGGISAFYAIAHGIPVVAMRSNYNPLTHNGYPVNATVRDYVQDAITLDPKERKDAGYAMIEREKADSVAGTKRFFEILAAL